MFGWFKGVRKPSPKRLIDLETQLDDVCVTIAWLKKSVVDLNARLATVQRQAKAAAVGTENDTTGSEGVAPRTPGGAAAALRDFPHSRRGW